MMNVQTMRRVVDTLQMERLPNSVLAAVQLWNGANPTHVRTSANHIFRFEQAGEPRYLRLAHERERSKAFIQAELDFIQHTTTVGLMAARPIPSTNGTLIESVYDGDQHYYAVVFDALQGEQPEIEELDDNMFRAWGRSLALLHEASRTFELHPTRPTWQEQIAALLETLPPDEAELTRIIQAGLDWMKELPTQDYGLIHGDFEMDNLVWDGQEFQVLDFDAGVYTWFAADIAIALQDVWLDQCDQREERLKWFFEGYARISKLPNTLQQCVPRFINLLIAVKVAQLLQAYSTTSGDGQPAWVVQMQDHHKGWLERKRAALKWE